MSILQATRAALPLADPSVAPAATRQSASPTRPFARVELHHDAGAILDIWGELERSAPCSIYQTRAWLLPWIETLGRKAGMAPLFVVALDAGGTPVALLCLGLVRRGPLVIATWLGGKDANITMPLVRRGSVWSRTDVAHLLGEASRACTGRRPDVFVLSNQPHVWASLPNPFVALPNQPSPSAAYGVRLPRDAEALFAAKLSKDTRKKLRKKEAKLAALGPLTHLIPKSKKDRALILDAFFTLKIARFKALGIASDFETPAMRAFIESACDTGGIELHALKCGDRIVAIYGGASHQGCWSGMFNAFDGDETIARSSPGDLLLMRLASKACDDGLEALDLGIGEARYKAALCDERIVLFDALVAISWRGSVAATAMASRQRAKRVIKQNARLMAVVKALRAVRAS